QFDDGEAAEEFLFGVEEVVIVDLGIFTKNPALRARVGLRGLALDLVAQGVLALVGVGKKSVIEEQEQPCEHHSRDKKRQRQAIQTDAAGLEGGDFVVLAEHAQGDKGGDQRGERRELVDEIRNEIAEIVHDNEEGDAVPGDVVEQFEEREGFKKRDESR